MDKQKKQLIFLGVAVAALLVVAAINLGWFDKKTPPPPPPPPLPAEQTAQTPATPGAPAPTPAERIDVPEDFVFSTRVVGWPVLTPVAGRDWEPEGQQRWPFDPLLVKNVEIVNPEMRRYIDEIKRSWVLAGITRTWQFVTERVPAVVEVGDEETEAEGPNPPQVGVDGLEDEQSERYEEVRVRRLVTEAWFVGRRAPFRINDRLTNTRFVITDIVFGPDETDPNRTPRALVRLRGDMGELLDIELAPSGRYGEDDPSRG